MSALIITITVPSQYTLIWWCICRFLIRWGAGLPNSGEYLPQQANNRVIALRYIE